MVLFLEHFFMLQAKSLLSTHAKNTVKFISVI